MPKVRAVGGFDFTQPCLPTLKSKVSGFVNGQFVDVDFNQIEINKNGVLKVLAGNTFVKPETIVPTERSKQFFPEILSKLKRISVKQKREKRHREKLSFS